MPVWFDCCYASDTVCQESHDWWVNTALASVGEQKLSSSIEHSSPVAKTPCHGFPCLCYTACSASGCGFLLQFPVVWQLIRPSSRTSALLITTALVNKYSIFVDMYIYACVSFQKNIYACVYMHAAAQRMNFGSTYTERVV
jgi:hypothetical protein